MEEDHTSRLHHRKEPRIPKNTIMHVLVLGDTDVDDIGVLPDFLRRAGLYLLTYFSPQMGFACQPLGVGPL